MQPWSKKQPTGNQQGTSGAPVSMEEDLWGLFPTPYRQDLLDIKLLTAIIIGVVFSLVPMAGTIIFAVLKFMNILQVGWVWIIPVAVADFLMLPVLNNIIKDLR